MTMHICCRPRLHLPCTMLNCDLRKLARWDDASSSVSSKPTDDEFSPSIFFSILHLFIKRINMPPSGPRQPQSSNNPNVRNQVFENIFGRSAHGHHLATQPPQQQYVNPAQPSYPPSMPYHPTPPPQSQAPPQPQPTYPMYRPTPARRPDLYDGVEYLPNVRRLACWYAGADSSSVGQ